jgi:hypothetical protein
VSKQNVPYALRHALWIAHKEKCVYCDQPLAFGELEIDHIIPESYSKNLALPSLLQQLELPPDFDLKSTENLLPAHGRCNRKKTDDVYKTAVLFFYFSMAAKQIPVVHALINKTKQINKRDNLLAQIADAIESGVITHMDIQREKQNPNTLKLSRPLVFVDGSLDSVNVEDVPKLLDRPVLVGGRPEILVTFSDSNGPRMEVQTCRQYRAALAAGFYALSTFDMKMEAFLKTVNAILAAAELVHTPKVSFVDSPFRGLADLELIPVSALPTVGPDDEKDIKAMGSDSLKDLLDRGEIKILAISSNELRIEWRWGLLMREICRADLDGDGIEDILCECYCWATEGTLGFGWTSRLTRRSNSELFTVTVL